MGNIMSTAAGVAVGSTVGHGLSSMCVDVPSTSR